METHLGDAAVTHRLGRSIGAVLQGGDVVALRGMLGAGKTTLVRGIADVLGVHDLSSPSFGIVHEHVRPQGGRFIHVDAWRLTSPDEVIELGWDEWSASADTIVCVEWAARIARPGEGLWQSLDPLEIELCHAAGGRVAALYWSDAARLASVSASGAMP